MKLIRYFIIVIVLVNAISIYAADKRVMIVSANYPSDDAIIQKFIDQVNAIEGVTAVHVPLADFRVMTDFSAYDAALLSTDGGSADMKAFSDRGWPIPAVNLKAYSLYKGDHPLFTMVAGENWIITPKSADLLEGVTWLTVEDNLDIFKGYQVGDSIQWTTGYNTTEALGIGAGEAHIQAFDLTNTIYTSAAIVENSTHVASNNYLVNNTLPIQTFLWKTEENSHTKRLVCWGIHHGFLEYATDDFYKILINSVKWILKIEDIPRLQNLTVDHGTLFPAFNPSVFEYKLAIDTVIDSVMITAQSFNTTDTITGSGYFSEIPGIAAIQVISEQGTISTYHIDISNHTEIPQLSGLTISEYNLSPAFNPDTTDYFVKLDESTTSVIINATTIDYNATIIGTGEFNSIPGTAVIRIISSYGIENNYSVHFNYKSIAKLSSLTLTNGSIFPSFHPNIFRYRFNVTDKPDSILITATTNDPNAIISDTGYFSAIPGNAVISVISEDSVCTKYMVKIICGESNACLAALSASTGNLEPVFDPDTLNYDLIIPNEINEVIITAVAEDENAQVTGDGLIGHFPQIITIKVVAEDTTTLEYRVKIYRSNEIMVVSADLPSQDLIIQNFLYHINAIEGVTATHVNLADFKVMTDFSAYDAVLITESGGSSDMSVFSDRGWPLPAVHLKAYSLYKGSYPLFTQEPGINWYTTNKSTDLLTGIDWLFIKNNRDIFTGYRIGDSIQWTTGYNTTVGIGAGEAHIQSFDLKNSTYTQPLIVAHSAPLASNKYLIYNDLPVQDFMWKIDENDYTKRMVCWGVHHGFLEYATDDFYNILKNSVKWVLNMKEQTGLSNLTVSHGTLFPEFDPNIFNYELAIEPDIDSVLITALPCNDADTVIGTGYFSKIPGKATIMVATANEEMVTYQISITYKTAIKKNSDNNLQAVLSPVPFDGQLTIRTLPGARIIISNQLGQTVYNGITDREGDFMVNTADLEKGVYIVSVFKDENVIMLKGIKQ